MSSSNESMKKVLTVAVLLCLVCSVVVSSAAVLLRDAQQANKALDMKKNILAAAGMLEEGVDIEKQFEKVDIRAVDFESGTYTDAVDPATYDQRKAAGDPAMSAEIPDDRDLAKINRQAEYGLVYVVNDEQGNLDTIILPVRGYGLWSTMHGFLALDENLNEVVGLGFYEHGETPGLGGEIDNPRWKAKWPGKKVYEDGEVKLSVVKGEVTPQTPDAEYKVDGLSGATLTSKGVDNLIKFWMGENGYGKFLSNLKTGEA